MKAYAYVDRISLASFAPVERPDPSFEALVRVMEQQKIKPAVDRMFPVAAFPAAVEYLANGGRFGKVALTFDWDLLSQDNHFVSSSFIKYQC
jgi:NADPH:quinone reductase-like Zn-dependent oxidoreductase